MMVCKGNYLQFYAIFGSGVYTHVCWMSYKTWVLGENDFNNHAPEAAMVDGIDFFRNPIR